VDKLNHTCEVICYHFDQLPLELLNEMPPSVDVVGPYRAGSIANHEHSSHVVNLDSDWGLHCNETDLQQAD
jgi:hypothetical protein